MGSTGFSAGYPEKYGKAIEKQEKDMEKYIGLLKQSK